MQRRHAQRQQSMNTATSAASFYNTSYELNWDVQAIDDALQTTPAEGKGVPLSIFSTRQPTLQTLVRYLREQEGLSFVEMAERLDRATTTLRATYANADKKEELLIKEGISIPLAIFRLGLSPLEALVFSLQKLGLKNVEIARMLKLDPRTTWTVQSRLKAKGFSGTDAENDWEVKIDA